MRKRTRYNKVPTSEKKYRNSSRKAPIKLRNQIVDEITLVDDGDDDDDDNDDDDVPNEDQQFLQQTTNTNTTTHIELNRIYRDHGEGEEDDEEEDEEDYDEEQDEFEHEYYRRRRQMMQHQHIRPHVSSTRSEGHKQQTRAPRRDESIGQLATLVRIPQELEENRTSRA